MQVSGKKFLLGLASWLFFLFSCNAQDIQTTPNLIGNQWSGAVTGGNYVPGGTSGGSTPAYNPSTNTILFGYTQKTVTQQIKLNEVLKGTNLRLYGYDYSLEYMNSDYSRGNATLTVDLKDVAGMSRQKDTYSLVPSSGWTTLSGTRPYGSPYNLGFVDYYDISITGKDDRYWAGYYGPQVRNISFSAKYVGDECKTNPLYSSTCPGFQEAYLLQQCNINPLYSPTCAGYAQAYQNQQCVINTLFNPSCPGYQQAYFNQQCSINPLYNSGCPGYAQAFFTKTCNDNPLSDTKCPLYESAYLNQQCSMNPLFSTACPLYQQAFFNQQCTANPLYNSSCPGYADAFRKKQMADACSANPQSNPQCPGYVTQQTTITVTTQTVSNVPSVGNEDVAKLLTTPQVTSDPIVNQAIAKPEAKVESTQPLGQGLTVSPTTTLGSTRQTRSSQQQGQSRESARETARANAVAAAKKNEPSPQEVALASMAEVPGFSSYLEVKIPDVPFYKVEDIYKRVTINDNARALRQLNQRSDRIHKEMVDEQYRK